MIVSNCPRCCEPLRVPTGELPDNAYAQCPWCRETFPLSDVLTKLPPILQVMSADGEPLAATEKVAVANLSGAAYEPLAPGGMQESDQSAATIIDDGLSDGFFPLEMDDEDDRVGSETVTEETISEDTWTQDHVAETEQDAPVDFAVEDPHETWESEQQAPISSMKVRPASKKKSKSSGIRTAIGVVLGGVASVPIAGGLLMVLGQTPDWGFWPFNGEGSSSRNAVAAPPAELSSEPLRTTSQRAGQSLSASLDDDALNASIDPADAALEEIMQPSEQEPSFDGDDGFADLQSLPAQPDASAGMDESLPTVEPEVTDFAAADPVGSSAGASIEMPAGEAGESSVRIVPIDAGGTQASDMEASNSEASNSEASGQDNALPGNEEPAELLVATQRAGEMVDELATFDGPKRERNAKLVDTYQRIAMACDLATGDSDALRSLANKIGTSPVSKEIELAAMQWLTFQGRGSDGIALIGQPSSGGEAPTITLSSGKVVSVAGDVPLPAAEKVMAMGRVMDGTTVEVVLVEPLP